jgi:sugar/nucleoside kinase (ribokinase family)
MTPKRPLDVLVVGDLFVELVMSGFASWPPTPGEEAFAERFYREAGGGAAITSSGLARLGVTTGVLGSIGTVDGEWMLERLRTNGVGVSTIQQTSTEPTAITVSVSSPADRTFLTYMGANRELGSAIRQAVSQDIFASTGHLHLACAPEPDQMERLLGVLSEKNCTVSIDVGWHPEWLSNQQCREALCEVDIFFPNEREAALITEESEPRRMLEALRKMGLERVALKLGSAGAALLYDGEILFQQAIKVETIDTTGAGDCFDAGFLFAWLHGDNPQDCLKVGTVCGALSTRRMGGIAGFPTLAELDIWK